MRALATALLAATLAAQAEDAQQLPRVLLIGDVGLNNHFQNAQKALKGKAEVVRSPLGHLSTGAALARIDELLQGKRWDVVCVNFGASDAMHKDPQRREVRAMSPGAGGVPVTPLAEFGPNLDRLVSALHAASDRVVWLATLPSPPQRRSTALRELDLDRYRAAASERMQQLHVEVVDLHAQIQAALAGAKNERQRNQQHGQLYKQDLSAPLTAALLEAPEPTEHKAEAGAHCERCHTRWGLRALRTCRLHWAAGVGMDPRCLHCRYHGAYKFLFANGLSEAQQRALRSGEEPARPR